MIYKQLLKRLLPLMLLPVAWTIGVHAQSSNEVSEETIIEETLGKRESKQLAEQITGQYKDWNRVAINGKVKSDLLPVTIGMRISMEKGKRLAVSLRVPLLGEMMRVEMTPGNLYIINRKNKTYHQMEYDEERPLLEYTQSILLGRPVIVGNGELSLSNYKKCEFVRLYDTDAAGTVLGYAMLPPALSDGVNYGYTLSDEGKITGIGVAIAEKLINVIRNAGGMKSSTGSDEYTEIINVSVDYANSGKASADIDVSLDKYSFSGIVECERPEFGAKLLEPFELTSRYKSVSLREVVRF